MLQNEYTSIFTFVMLAINSRSLTSVINAVMLLGNRGTLCIGNCNAALTLETPSIDTKHTSPYIKLSTEVPTNRSYLYDFFRALSYVIAQHKGMHREHHICYVI